jgi:RiboL-PSP-HEPN
MANYESPLDAVKQISRTRFSEVRVHLNYLQLEENDKNLVDSVQLKILRGMFYVHLYGAFEKVINEAVERTLLAIDSLGTRNDKYITEFNTVTLFSKVQSLRDTGHKGWLSKAHDVFKSVGSGDVFKIDNTMFSVPLQNVWHETLRETLACFGLRQFEQNSRDSVAVDEVVDRRNAIAHGRESPANVGERFRCIDLKSRMDSVQKVADLFVETLESYVTNQQFLKLPTASL